MKVQDIFEKKEAVRYLFWGVITVVANYASYLLLKIIMPYQAANLLSIIFTKVFAYCTNKKFVFQTETHLKEQVTEIARYILGRGVTGLVDFLGLIALTELFWLDDRLGKMIMIVVTTILNYFLGKLFVFKKGSMDQQHGES